MSRRQALGVLTNNTNNANGFASKNPTNQTNNGNLQTHKQPALLGKSSSTSNFPPSSATQYNDENEAPKSTYAPQNKNGKAISSDLDFEIFQEDYYAEPMMPSRSGEENDRPSQNKENNEEEEEEGISRLNLAAIGSVSDSVGSSCRIINQDFMMIMDSSSHSDSSSSPMILDDTIKFLSKIDDDEEEEEPDQEEEEHDCDQEDDDQETRHKFEVQKRENALMNCLEYKDDILAYMRQLECENRPKASYMKKQLDITGSMRSILIDWLVEVCEEYRLNVETLYLAVSYTDRFLSQMSVLRGKLQLVGTASMYIASKYEEITPPDVNEFVYITDDTYTKKQVLRMEHLLLKVLDFRMSQPTINWFLSHFLRFIKLQTNLNNANNIDLYQRIDNLARYLAELTLIDAETFLVYVPSQIAASAIYLAMYTLGRPWTRQIADIIGYAHDLTELKACISDLHKSMLNAETHPQQAIQEKYKQSKYEYVALIEPPKSLPQSFLAAQ